MARTEFDVLEGGPVASSEQLVRAMEAVHEVYVSDTFTDHVVEIVKRTRNHPALELGASPAPGSPWSRARAPGLDPRPELRDSRRPLRPGRGRDPASHPPELRGPGRRPDRLRGAQGNSWPFGASPHCAEPAAHANGRARDRAVVLIRPDREEPWRTLWKAASRVMTSWTRGSSIMAVKRLADSLSYGTDHSPFLGAGIEYVQSRPYQYGDPDQADRLEGDGANTQGARQGVRSAQADAGLPADRYVGVDDHQLASQASKYETAVFLAGGLALACLERISPVGLLGIGGQSLHVRPSLSKDQIMQWLHKLRTYRYDEPTSLGSRLAELIPSLSHRVLVIVLSDLHDPRALPSLRRLAQQHDAVVLQTSRPCRRAAARRGLRPGPRGRDRLGIRRPRAGPLARPGADQRRAEEERDRPSADRDRQARTSHGSATSSSIRNLLGRGAR